MKNYTLKKILKVVRHLEAEISPGHNCHFAIGGSCVMKGKSEKDFDIFVYPRKGKWVNPNKIIYAIEQLGWTCEAIYLDKALSSAQNYPDKQLAIITTPTGYRIDLFFMSNISEVEKQ